MTSSVSCCNAYLETSEKSVDSDDATLGLHSRLNSFSDTGHEIRPAAHLQTIAVLLGRLNADERAALARMLNAGESAAPLH